MTVQSPVLLDIASSLRDAVTTLFQNLFTFQNAIIALALTFGLAILGWLVAYFILRHKEVCSMVCSIHFLSVILTIIAGIIGAFGFIDHYKGSLITGAGFSLLVLTIPIFILVESFNYVVLGNKHARHHRDLRTPADKRVRRTVVLLTPLLIGLALVGVGVLVGAAVGPTTEVIILLLTLWVMALCTEVIFLGRARQRRHRLAALPSGSALDQEQLAALWVGGIGSYRIGRGRTEAVYWEEFTERVVVTEELLLEEEGELDLVEVEEQETVSYTTISAVAGGAAVATGPALHRQHRLKRHAPAHRFRRRWGGVTALVLLTVVALAVCVITNVSALIALAFLAPAIYLMVYRIRRDNDVRFVTETAEKVNAVQAATVVASSRVTVATAEAAAPARPASANPPGLRPARPTPVIPPATPPVILPKEEPEPPTLPSVEVAEQASQEAAVAAGAAHENPDIAEETVLFPGRAAAAAAAAAVAAGAAHENPDIADDTLLIAHTPATPAAEEELNQTQVDQYFQGASYPATRAQALAAARKNNAPRYLTLWLEEIEESYTFTSVTEVYHAYTVYMSVRGVHYPATRAQVQERALATRAPRTVILWLETVSVTTVFVSLTEITRSYVAYAVKGAADEAEEPTIVAPRRTRSVKITRSIGIIEFQHYLHGIDYPATREQLLAQARLNNAPPNMIARLEELEEHYRFLNVSDVMLGYAYHRYLRGVHFPATKAELLEHARQNSATPKLITRLEALDDKATFASLEDVLRRSHAGHVVEEIEEEDEEEVEDEEAEEETLTLSPAPAAAAPIKADSRIRITEFQHYLHGIKYPATRDELLAQARQNNAPPNMIARLEELPAHHHFKTASEVMRGYAHRVEDDEQ